MHNYQIQKAHRLLDTLAQSIRNYAARPWLLVDQTSDAAAATDDVLAGAAKRLTNGAELAREIRSRGWIDDAYYAEKLALHAKFRNAFDAVARHLHRGAS